MLQIVFVETALETVPPPLQEHPSVRRDAERRGKSPSEVILDRSLHHSAMRRLPNAHKRGRPDIIHFCLLEALGSPLNLEGNLRVWVHTIGGYGIEVSPETRLPRDCLRFKSLMEQLFALGRVPPTGKTLLTLSKMSLSDLLKRGAPSRTIALTSHGTPRSLEAICEGLAREENPAVLIGAYPTGAMEEETLSMADEAHSIYPKVLEAWVVTSRLIYAYERARIH